MFLNIICLTNMLANNRSAGINTFNEGAPHMLRNNMLATSLLDAVVQAANRAAFFMGDFRLKLRYFFTYGTVDPVAKIMHQLEQERKKKNNL